MHADVRGMAVPFLYQDDVLVIVNKPAGMLVHRSPGARDPIVVMMHVRDVVGTHTWPVHRLDRATSGAVIVALDKECARRLSKLFLKGRVSKTYLALGTFSPGMRMSDASDECPMHPPLTGRIEYPLEKRGGVMQDAVTDYECLATRDGLALLRVQPLQGRRHQIRRHLQSVGLPLAGDEAYGDPTRNELLAERHGLRRLALHASRLCFTHPITGAPIDVEAPVPDDLIHPLAHMQLWPIPGDLCISGTPTNFRI